MSETPGATPPEATDDTTTQEGTTFGADPVPEPPSGVRGADAVDRMDNDPGHGTTTGADGDTAAREQMRVDQGERRPDADREGGDDLEQSGALGDTDDPSSAGLGDVSGR